MGGPGAGPPQKKGGPPVALLVGGGCGLLAVIGVILLLVLVVFSGDDDSTASTDDDSSSSSGKDDSDDDDDGGGGDPMAGSVFKRIPSTNVEVPVPPGWREDKRSLYTFAIAGDGNALLAFTTVSSLGEWAGRTQHAVKVFRITNCNMEPATRVRLGPNKLRARLKEGKCKFNGVPSQVATVLVETGRRAHPFIIYAVDNRASKRTQKQAIQTIARMRKR